MKRHAELSPLSQEHHHTLALCLRILRCPEADMQSEIAAHIAGLERHFLEEEQKFISLWHSIGRPDLQQRFNEEHAALRQLFSKPEYGNPEWKSRLAELLRAHIRFEERELFPAFEPFLNRETR